MESLCVLMVENDEADAHLIMHAVMKANPGARVDLAVTREQFTALLRERSYDIVLSDYRLPDWTGMEVLLELRKLRFDIPLIIVTGELGDERAVECLKGGAADYILKGPSMARLPIAVQRAIDEKEDRDEALHAVSLEAQLRQAQKMEAVGRLAGGVAHDFNNLLTVITGYTDILMSQFAHEDPRLEDLREIRKAAEGAASLTRQLLAFSRQQVIKPKVITLEDVVKRSHKLLVRLIGEDIELATRFGATPCVVLMDPGQLEQVITNLAVNSRDAMPTGGSLTIETSVVDLDGRYAETHWPVTTGRFAMLAVSDTGMGMDETTRSKIFEPFFTTKDPGKGTGLGLATVYGIVKQSGGYIWAYSEPGHGATFKVYLPLYQDTVPSSLEAQPERRSPHGNETILLVEDSVAVRNIALRTLEQYGYDVIDAPSPNAALAVAAALGRPVHLLLTDVVMPEMSGRVLAEKFAALQPNAKVLYMSGYTDDAIIRHGVLRAKTPFLQKPFTPLALATRVREVFDN